MRINQAISAYLWQSALTDSLPKHKPETPRTQGAVRNARLPGPATPSAKETRCQGGTFAANLTRVGEKDNYDYLVRWVHNRASARVPYCPYEKKDIGPKITKEGLPYVFDLDHSRCPNDGHELQVQNMTVHAPSAPFSAGCRGLWLVT